MLLGFCKLEDKWQLVTKETTITYEWDRDNDAEDEIRDVNRAVALSKSPRDIRLLAVEKFDALLGELSGLALRKIVAIESAAALAEPIAAPVPGSKESKREIIKQAVEEARLKQLLEQEQRG